VDEQVKVWPGNCHPKDVRDKLRMKRKAARTRSFERSFILCLFRQQGSRGLSGQITLWQKRIAPEDGAVEWDAGRAVRVPETEAKSAESGSACFGVLPMI
jgi:hypothetical protein